MKKFTRIFITVLLCATCFLSGCNLFATNTDRYTNRIVAKIGDTTVTKNEVVSVYSTYGSQYIQNGYTQAQTFEFLAKSLLNNKLLTNYAKSLYTAEPYNYSELVYGEISDKTNITHYNTVLQNVYDRVNQNLLSIENLIRAEQGLELVEETQEETQTPTFSPFKAYEKKIARRWNSDSSSYEYYVIQEEKQQDSEVLGDFVQDIHGSAEIAKQAWGRYIKTLKNYEAGKNLSTSAKDIFEREVKRLFESYADQQYLDWFEEVFKDNLRVDSDRVVEKYIELVETSRATYSTNYSSYVKDMQSSNGKVYYHPFDDSQSFVLVSHVLIKYSDAQIAKIKEIKSDLEQGYINQDQYDKMYKEIQLSTTAKARNTEGFEYGDDIPLAQIYKEIKDAVERVGTDVTKRAEVFNSFIYKYGQDTGVINAENYYAVNMDTTQTDTMVKNFADESRRLQNEEGAGSLSEPIFVESSNYSGFHIIFCVGLAKNIVPYSSLRSITADKLFDTRVMAGVDKSYYDLVYDMIVTDTYSEYRTSKIKELQDGKDFEIMTSALTDLISDGSKFENKD